MTHNPHAVVQKNNSISYRRAFPYVALGAMIAALFLVYIVTSASMTSATFSLEQFQAEGREIIALQDELLREQSIRNSLEYISDATESLGLEEIRYATYLELQESGIVVKR